MKASAKINNLKRIAIGAGALLAALIILPNFAFANTTGLKANVLIPTADDFALKGPLLVCTGVPNTNSNNGAPNATCQNVCDLITQIANIIYFLIAVVLWIVTPILVATGGLMIMLGGASPEMVGRGKKTITGAVWGVVIILCSWLIVFTFIKAFGGLSKYVGGFGGQAACVISGGTGSAGNSLPDTQQNFM
jgi:hypothetical protein